MLGHPEEEVVGDLAAVVEHGNRARVVERAHAPVGRNAMSRSANAATNAREVSGDGGTGLASGITNEISQASRTPRAVR